MKFRGKEYPETYRIGQNYLDKGVRISVGSIIGLKRPSEGGKSLFLVWTGSDELPILEVEEGLPREVQKKL